MGAKKYSPKYQILHFGTKLRKVVSFKLQPINSWGKESQYSSDKRLDGSSFGLHVMAMRKIHTPARN
jgi:hypothetical protein